MSRRFQVELNLKGENLGLLLMHDYPKKGETMLIDGTYVTVTEVIWLVAPSTSDPFDRVRVVLDAGPEEIDIDLDTPDSA